MALLERAAPSLASFLTSAATLPESLPPPQALAVTHRSAAIRLTVGDASVISGLRGLTERD